jgi:hypothetical protein
MEERFALPLVDVAVPVPPVLQLTQTWAPALLAPGLFLWPSALKPGVAGGLGSALLRRTGLDDLLNFVRETVEMSVQPVVHIAFDLVDCEVPDQRRVGGIVAQFFDRSAMVFHGLSPRLFERRRERKRRPHHR